MEDSCPVCIEDYKGKKVERIKCQYCPSHACRGCQKKYILQSSDDPHCMECKRPWNAEFMAANFPITFRKGELRKWRAKILVEREKPSLAAMQVYVGYKREISRLHEVLAAENNNYNSIWPESVKIKEQYRSNTVQRARIKNLIQEAKDSLAKETEDSEQYKTTAQNLSNYKQMYRNLKEQYAAMTPKYRELSKKQDDSLTAITNIRQALFLQEALYDDRMGDSAPKQRREFIMKCPDEECRGFLSSAYKCGTCEKWTCASCLVVLGPEKECGHTCNADALETAKMIKTETKPCPKCGTRIMKTEGCDQMWCVMEGCNTAFSWNTGQIVTGRIHNPHYYEWLRRTGGGNLPREPGDIPCGGIPDWWMLNRVMRTMTVPPIMQTQILETHRHLVELTVDRLASYPANIPTGVNKELHVKYLMKEITDAEWQRGLELVEARYNRKREIGQILNTIATLGAESMRQIIATAEEYAMMPDTTGQSLYRHWLRMIALPNLEKLREYGNETLRELGEREKMAVPQLGQRWDWQPIRILYKETAASKKAAAAAAAAAGAEVVEVPSSA